MTNAEIAARLMSLAQLLAVKKENPFKVKAYRRAAKTIETMVESVDRLVRADEDLTEYSGIGKGISGALREIVLSGNLRQLDELRSAVKPEVAAISEYPRLDPARVLRIYKKLAIGSVEELRHKLESGEIAKHFGVRMDQHVRSALEPREEMLLANAEPIVAAVEQFMLAKCGVKRVEATGDFRRRVEVVSKLSFLVETDDLLSVSAALEEYSGHLKLESATPRNWGIALLKATGSATHLEKLGRLPGTGRDETEVYRKLGLSYIEPELREGLDEIDLARRGELPVLVSAKDIRGELHAHSTSSDGVHTIDQMARAALKKGYEYTGITDHSQSLKIAGGLSPDDLWKQIRFIDRLNEKGPGILILKSAEVDILADGSLDYPDDLLKELDYTVCSIHSKFSMGKAEQTERILRAMDNPYFSILGHATGRMLLKRPGYEIDVARVLAHAKQNGCFLEINSSPDRLDLSAANARLAREAGVKIAVNTDAHSTREYDLVRYGMDQARRAGLTKHDVLNTRSWPELRKLLRRV